MDEQMATCVMKILFFYFIFKMFCQALKQMVFEGPFEVCLYVCGAGLWQK